MAGPSKKNVSFGPLEESFTHSNKFISCITDENLIYLRVKYHIPEIVKLRVPTANERPYHMHGGNVSIYLEAISGGLHFPVHPFL